MQLIALLFQKALLSFWLYNDFSMCCVISELVNKQNTHYCYTVSPSTAGETQLAKPHSPQTQHTMCDTMVFDTFYDSYMCKVVFKGLHLRYNSMFHCLSEDIWIMCKYLQLQMTWLWVLGLDRRVPYFTETTGWCCGFRLMKALVWLFSALNSISAQSPLGKRFM